MRGAWKAGKERTKGKLEGREQEYGTDKTREEQDLQGFVPRVRGSHQWVQVLPSEQHRQEVV
jgi:hypothetical protein